MSMKRRLNGSYQGKRAMHKARQRAKFKRQAQQRRNSKYYYKPNQKTKSEPMSDTLQIIIGAIVGFIIFVVFSI